MSALHMLILASAFFTATLLTLAVYQAFFASRLAVLHRLQVHAGEVGTFPQEQKKGDMRSGLLDFLGVLGRMLPRSSGREEMQKKLLQAHLYIKVEEYLGLVMVSSVIFFLLIYLLTGIWIVGVLGGILGFKVPGLMVDRKRAAKTNKLTDQLPEALDIVSNGLRAGFSFPQAMAVVSKEMPPPISDEFARVIWENRMGKSLEEALLNMGERTNSDDLNLLITALLIHKQVGGNLAEILDNISHTIRERVKIKGEIRTLTAEGRMSAVIMALLPVVVAGAIAFLNPEYMLTLVQEPLGILMVVGAVIMQFIGIMVIRNIVNIEV